MIGKYPSWRAAYLCSQLVLRENLLSPYKVSGRPSLPPLPSSHRPGFEPQLLIYQLSPICEPTIPQRFYWGMEKILAIKSTMGQHGHPPSNPIKAIVSQKTLAGSPSG